MLPLAAGLVRQPSFLLASPSASLILSVLASPLAAQIDYRNLDADRPAVTEDAYPIERYAFEIVAPYRFESDNSVEIHTVVPELVYGLTRNSQVGLELPLAAIAQDTGTDWGLAGLHILGLYNFNTEGPRLPAISLRGDMSFPVGSLAGDGVRVGLTAIATRGWGRTRAHLNASRGFGSEANLSLGESLPRWSASLALDRTFFRSSLLLVGEIATVQPVDGARAAVNASLGGRWQWTPTLVLDAGVARRLRSGAGPDIALTVGVSHSFAVRALMPGLP